MGPVFLSSSSLFLPGKGQVPCLSAWAGERQPKACDRQAPWRPRWQIIPAYGSMCLSLPPQLPALVPGRPGPSPWWPWARLAALALPPARLGSPGWGIAAWPLCVLLRMAQCRGGRLTREITLWWLNENMALRRREKKNSAWTVAFFDGRGGRWLAGHCTSFCPCHCRAQWAMVGQRDALRSCFCAQGYTLPWEGTIKEHNCWCGEEQATHSWSALKAVALSHVRSRAGMCTAISADSSLWIKCMGFSLQFFRKKCKSNWMRGNGQSLTLLLAPEISMLAEPKPGSVGAFDTGSFRRLQAQLRLEAAHLCQCGAVFNQTHLELGCNAGKRLV